MNGVNAPKVVECFGSDGHKYRQLAKSGNDDLRQDAVGIRIVLFILLNSAIISISYIFFFKQDTASLVLKCVLFISTKDIFHNFT